MVSFPGRDMSRVRSSVASVDGRISWLLSGRPAISKFGLSRDRDRENEPDSVGEGESVSSLFCSSEDCVCELFLIPTNHISPLGTDGEGGARR